MPSTIHLRFAMETWSVTFQSLLSPESLALSASKGDFQRLQAIVRTLGFGLPSGMQQDG